MSNYELMKKKAERHKVVGAKMEMELRILEKERDIEKLKKDMEVQELAVKKLDQEIQKLES